MPNKLIKDFLDYKERNGKSVEGYEKDIRIFLSFLPSLDLSQINTKDIISTLKKYIEESKITSVETALRYKSSIKDFLNFLIGEEIIKNDTLLKEFGYNPIYTSSYIGRMNKYIANNPSLKEKKDFIAISDEDIKQLILDCNDTTNDKNILARAVNSSKYYNKILSAIIIKLIIYIGISYRCLRKIRYQETLNLKYNTIKINKYTIHLPHNLRDQFVILDNLLLEIDEKNQNREYLFIKYDGSQLSSQTSSSNLSNNLKDYTGRQDINGVIRSTIIHMILHGLNEGLIKNLTGIESTIYDPCQQEANDLFSTDVSTFLDSKLRSINTFDLL